MSFSHLRTAILWFIPLVLQSAIVVVMLRRRLVRIFPIFFSYTVLVPSRDIVLLFLPYPATNYSLVYFSGEALAVLLGLGVLLENIRHLFPPYPFLRLVLKSLWISGAIAAGIALLMLVLTRGGAEADGISESIMLLERSARFLQASLLIVVIALISRLGLTWHHYSVGIVAGFGIYSALALALFEFRAHLHIVSDSTLALLNSAAYNVAAIIWAFYFLRSWRMKPVEHLPETNLDEWNEAVTEYIDQWYRRH